MQLRPALRPGTRPGASSRGAPDRGSRSRSHPTPRAGSPFRLPAAAGIALLVLACTAAHAQVRGRLLEAARVDDARGTLTVRFNAPVNVSTYTPRREGRLLRIGLRLAGVSSTGISARETLRAAPTAAVPVSDIRFQVESGLEPTLELAFTRTARFDVAAGSDARSVVITFEKEAAVAAPAPRPPQGSAAPAARPPAPTPPAAATAPSTPAAPAPPAPAPVRAPERPTDEERPYAINLMSSSAPVDLGTIALDPEHADLALYTVQFEAGGKVLNRVRVGFFASIAAAEAVAVRLRERYPGAWVARASRTERARFAGSGRAAPGPRPATQPGTSPGPRTPRAARAPASDVPRVPLSPQRQEALREEGRNAMTAKDYRTAIRVFGKLQRDGDDAARKEAQELLALARERNGQLAQAKAEYETYLERYPDGEDAERVRQRLQGLLTARRAEQAPLRESSRQADGASASPWRVFGSFSQFYRNLTRRVDGGAHDVVLSSLPTDLSVSAAGAASGYDLRADFTGGYEHDFLDSSDSEASISTMSVFAERGDWGLSAEVGRQTRSSGGVLGRFDGAVLSYGLSSTTRVNAVFGYPVLRTSDTSLNSDEYFYGMSVELGGLVSNWEFILSAIEQREDGLVERRAIGGETRYFDRGRSLFVLMDYDIKFAELNTLLALGTLTFDNGASLNASFDRRKSPVLTITNALQGLFIGGVPITTISEARRIFSDEELEQFARDRDTTITTATLSGTLPVSEKLQVSADVTATHTTDTAATFDPRLDFGAVGGSSGTGVDFLYNLQLIGSSVIKPGDIGIVGVRYSDLNLSDVYSLNLNARYPVSDRIRVNPRIDFIYRANDRDSGERFTFRPDLRLEYRPTRRSQIEAEFLFEWLKDRAPLGDSLLRTFGFNLGYRLDF